MKDKNQLADNWTKLFLDLPGSCVENCRS